MLFKQHESVYQSVLTYLPVLSHTVVITPFSSDVF